MAHRSQNKLIPILIIILGATAGYIVYSQSEAVGPSIDLLINTRQDDIGSLEGLLIDFSILDDGRLNDLKIQGQSPIEPGRTGKKDIFAPIGAEVESDN